MISQSKDAAPVDLPLQRGPEFRKTRGVTATSMATATDDVEGDGDGGDVHGDGVGGDGGDGDEPPFGGLLGSCRGQFLSRLGPALGPCWKLCRSILNGVRVSRGTS